MNTNKAVVTDLDLQGKRVLIRVDVNVSLKNGTIVDDTRIDASLATLRHVLAERCPLIVMSHLGRPRGERVNDLSLRPVAAKLADKLQCNVKLTPDWLGVEVEEMAAALQSGEILVLENTRFHAVEEGKDGVLEDEAKKLEAAIDPKDEETKRKATEARRKADEARARLKLEQPIVAKQLAGIADVYINDDFGAAHRRHGRRCGHERRYRRFFTGMDGR